MDIEHLPVLGICGFSGSGKTTLIEELLRRPQFGQLKIAVVKHSSKTIELDLPGKDSYRFFSAGADVFLHSVNEHFCRSRSNDTFSLNIFLRDLTRRYDLVFVEGYKDADFSKVLLLNRKNEAPAEGNGPVLGRFEFEEGRVERLSDLIEEWLPKQWNKVPVYGCVLTGGKSTRMGRDKHLIQKDGKTWLEHTVEKLSRACSEIVVAGGQTAPTALKVHHIPDIRDACGPIGGMGAAFRWNPWVSWIIAACDLPDIQGDAIDWLLGQRGPGIRAVLPTLDGGRVEPLFALYDLRIQSGLEAIIYSGEKRPSALAKIDGIRIVSVPSHLRSSWRNVNYPEEI